MNNSSSSSGEGGNTKPPLKKQISPSIRWCMTLNNYTDEELLDISAKVPLVTKYCIIGKEVGDASTPHLQGYMEFKKKVRPSTVFKTNRIHWEKAKGSKEDNNVYCTKENLWIEFPEVEKIECIEYKDLKKWQLELIDIYNSKPDHRTIHWFWGKGNIGKTEMVRYLYLNYGVPFSYGGAVGDVMNLAYNNINKSKAFVFSLTRFKKNRISYDALEQLKDGALANNKYETGNKVVNRPHVFVFSNYPPEADEEEDNMTIDKIKVIELEA